MLEDVRQALAKMTIVGAVADYFELTTHPMEH